MPTTLSPRQLEVLKRLAEPGARAIMVRYQQWTFHGKPMTATIDALVEAGLCDVEGSWKTRYATINDAGRAVVDNLTSKP